MGQIRPEVRRYAIELTGGTIAAGVRWGDNRPNMLGWDVSYQTEHGSNSAMIVGVWTCREDWYQDQTVGYGDDTTGTLMTQGGRVFIPYSTVKLQCYDQNGVGDATVQVLARPVVCGDVPIGNPSLYGLTAWNADTESTATVTVPDNANMFCVSRGELAAGSIRIEAVGLTDKIYWMYQLGTDAADPFGATKTPWRECPPADNAGNGSLRISNSSGENAAAGFVHWRFDFTQGR